jgi:hypothetical protein
VDVLARRPFISRSVSRLCFLRLVLRSALIQKVRDPEAKGP